MKKWFYDIISSIYVLFIIIILVIVFMAPKSPVILIMTEIHQISSYLFIFFVYAAIYSIFIIILAVQQKMKTSKILFLILGSVIFLGLVSLITYVSELRKNISSEITLDEPKVVKKKIDNSEYNLDDSQVSIKTSDD